MKFPLPFLIFFLLIGCRPIPPYKPPDFALTENWKEGKGEAIDDPNNRPEKWWHLFNDSRLNELEERALDNNPNLEATLWRISEAWATAQAAASPLYPNISFAPNTSNQLQLIKIPGYSGTPVNPLVPTPSVSPLQRFKSTQYNLPFTASYEFDLWYKLHYEAEAAFANAEAQENAWRAAQLTLTGAVANSYFTIRIHDSEEKILIDTIRVRTEALEINRTRYEAGLINYADVSRAETEMWLAKVDLSRTLQLRALQEHLLATLTGDIPAEFNLKALPLTGDPPIVIPIIPSEVLLRRPDLNQAERELAAFYAEEGYAYATLFPSLSIDTAIGYSSPILGELLSWKARFFSLAWTSLQTIFDAGKKQADVAAARARFQQSLYRYSDRVLNAFKEVENALSSLKWEELSLKELLKAVDSAQTSTDLANERYDRGLVTYLEVVDAERTLLDTQLNAVRVRGDRFIGTIDLIKSLGGSWSNEQVLPEE